LLLVLAALLAAAGRASPASAAEPSAAEKRQAAASFDDAVAKYNRADFAEAARAFLEADRLSPSTIAITNAIAAARRANEHLLVARAAERAIARGDALVEARSALAEAAAHLARLELSCDAARCDLSVDGAPAEGAAYVLPGTHRLEARGDAGAGDEERVVCVAGTTYRIALHPAAAPAPPPAPAPAPAAPRGLPRAVFFVGLGVTAVLGGVTAWSGADAIAAKNALGPVSTQPLENDVLQRARRTDFLLLGTGLAGVGTAIVAGFTSWRGGSASAALVPLPFQRGVAVAVEGRFR
jgi:hypothetical protein